MQIFTLSDKGKVRPNNEDYVEGLHLKWCGPNGKINEMTSLILADGMGGAVAGEYAATLAVRTVRGKIINGLLNHPPEELFNTDYKTFLKNAFDEANNVIYYKSREEPDLEGMGTTIVATIFYRGELIIGHVGDSRGYLYRGGKLEQITRDHSLVQELIAEGKITPEEALSHPNRNIITRALGVDVHVEPDCNKISTEKGDIFLLCSDGLSGFADPSGINKAFSDFGTPPNVNLSQLAERLLQLAYFGGGGDNISIALCYINE